MAAGKPRRRWIPQAARDVIGQAKKFRRAATAHERTAKGAFIASKVIKRDAANYIASAIAAGKAPRKAARNVKSAVRKTQEQAKRSSRRAFEEREKARRAVGIAKEIVEEKNPAAKRRGRRYRKGLY